MLEKLKGFIVKMNDYGIPIPLARINGAPTFTGTMALLSFTTAILGQIGKITAIIGEVDLTQANYLVIITLGTYVGRRFQSNGTTKEITMEKKDE